MVASSSVPADTCLPALALNRLFDVLPCTGGDVQHLWVKPDRNAAQTKQLFHSYSNLSSLKLCNSTCIQTTVPNSFLSYTRPEGLH